MVVATSRRRGVLAKGQPAHVSDLSQPEIASVGKGLKKAINIPGAKQTCCSSF